MSDYIKREDAIRQIVKTSAQNELDIPAIGTVIYILSEMDSADVRENVRGEWIDDGIHGDWAWETDGHGVCWQIWKCSRCGRGTKIRSNFCPNCGADMRGKQDG